jgi:hypothetical protein
MLAAELVSPGGPSAPVWAFFTAITLAILGIIGQQVSAKRAANEAKIEAAKAAKNSRQASENTANLSNGFAGNVDSKLNRILGKQDDMERAFREHLEWHLDNPPSKG